MIKYRFIRDKGSVRLNTHILFFAFFLDLKVYGLLIGKKYKYLRAIKILFTEN